MHDQLRIFTGSGNPQLTRDICDYLGLPLGRANITRFSNENIFVQIEENVRERDCFVVQPLSSPVSENLVELLIMLDALRSASAQRITAVIPYYSYARSDKKDMPRISVAARLVADLLGTAGATRVLTMTLHSEQVQGFFSVPTDHLTATPIIARHFQEMGCDDFVAVAPDAGSARRAGAYATRLGIPLALVDKRRVNDQEVELRAVVGDVVGKSVIIFDDEIATGTSLLETVNVLASVGVRAVYAGCTHGVLCGPAITRIAASPLQQVVVTDTVPLAPEKRIDKITVLSVAPLFGEAIKRIHTGESVSSLFV
jgi:ribose-phosphate pyrophosphokinase